MTKPAIIMPEHGAHNANLAKTAERLKKAQSYRDLSTIWICPTRGGRSLPPRAVSTWMGLLRPMNQRVYGPIWLEGMEVAEAYNQGIEMILGNDVLRGFRYLLTVEDDNMPPPDGLLKLYEAIEGAVDGTKYDVVQGLYFTKGEGGQPMIYGDPQVTPINFIPQVPRENTVQRCNGLGMGFNLWRMSIFTSGKLAKPWFKTEQKYEPGKGASSFTQDLYFFKRAAEAGYKVACDTRVKVGHLDPESGMVW